MLEKSVAFEKAFDRLKGRWWPLYKLVWWGREWKKEGGATDWWGLGKWKKANAIWQSQQQQQVAEEQMIVDWCCWPVSFLLKKKLVSYLYNFLFNYLLF